MTDIPEITNNNVFEIVDGILYTDNRTVSIPLFVGNKDYDLYLRSSGKTHEQVLAEIAQVKSTQNAINVAELTKQRNLKRSAKAKLTAATWQPLTNAELKALFGDE